MAITPQRPLLPAFAAWIALCLASFTDTGRSLGAPFVLAALSAFLTLFLCERERDARVLRTMPGPHIQVARSGSAMARARCTCRTVAGSKATGEQACWRVQPRTAIPAR